MTFQSKFYRSFRIPVLGTVALLLFYGCQTSDLAKSGDGRGKLLRMDTVNKQVTLDHDRIPAMMQSLIMAYPIRNIGMFNGLHIGDSVSFTLTLSSPGKYLVTRMTKIPPKS